MKAGSGRDHVELDLGALAGVTDRGLRHPRNEDAMALATADTPGGPAAIAVVCDGVSTSDRPDEASMAGAEAAAAILEAALRAGGDAAQASADAIAAATAAVTGITGPGRPARTPPASTYVSAVIVGAGVTVCWAGDSRAYWLPAGPAASAQLLTTDDSWAHELIAGGVPEAEALASPHAHQITRWLGPDGRTQDPRVVRFAPAGDGVVLLCSDGLWGYRPEPAGLAALALPVALTDPLAAAAELITFALRAGGQDNITAVLARFPVTPGARHHDRPDKTVTVTK